MFPWVSKGPRQARRFPRIRGDVPRIGTCKKSVSMFSPHTRGCSYTAGSYPSCHDVFPAYAGMFLSRSVCVAHFGGFPRIRGDVPMIVKVGRKMKEFSPHTRGCSGRNDAGPPRASVFPAYAGMFPFDNLRGKMDAGFPRIRGDVPSACSVSKRVSEFSPHTRGCSAFTYNINT